MTSSSETLSQPRLRRRVCWLLLLLCLLGLIPIQRSIDLRRGSDRGAADVLFLPSGKFLRQLSLGYEGLLADIYWTRVVQYFGRKRLAHSTEFKLLGLCFRSLPTWTPTCSLLTISAPSSLRRSHLGEQVNPWKRWRSCIMA